MVHVQLLRAVNLPKMDLLSSSDAFVRLDNSDSSSTATSSVKENTSHPEWNEMLKVGVINNTDPVRLSVFDKDTMSPDDLIGFGVLSMSPLQDGKWHDVACKLLDENWKESRDKGTVLVRAAYAPHSADGALGAVPPPPPPSKEFSLPVEQPIDEESKQDGPVTTATAAVTAVAAVDAGSAGSTTDSTASSGASTTTEPTEKKKTPKANFLPSRPLASFAGVVHLFLERGHGLPKLDTDGWCDPYLVLENSDSTFKVKSEIAKDTKDPVWMQMLQVGVHSSQDPIRFTVFDWDSRSDDDFVGYGVINMNKLTGATEWNDVRVPLMDKNWQVKNRLGAITLKVVYTANANVGVSVPSPPALPDIAS